MVGNVMNNELINQLSKLSLEKSALKRNIDRNYYNYSARNRLFFRLKEVDNEIKRVKFKIRLEKEKKNENNNTN
jgi:hypothetical protein